MTFEGRHYVDDGRDEFDGLLWEHVNQRIPDALRDFDERVFGVLDVDPIVSVSCGDFDGGDVTGYVARGKHIPDAVIRELVAYESGEWFDEYDGREVFRGWGRLEPWSLVFPDEPPCEWGGEEPEIWQWYTHPVPFGEPVTVLHLD